MSRKEHSVSDGAMQIRTERVDKLTCPKCRNHVKIAGKELLSIVECPHCHTRLPVPAKLGQFMLLKVLSKGAMATVYEAYDRSLNRQVMLQVLHEEAMTDKALVKQFLKGVRAMAGLTHPNVLHIHSLGMEQNQPYVVMEMVVGDRAKTLLEFGQPVPPKKAMRIGIDVAEGLKAALGLGLVHGDVSPATILVSRRGEAKVVDFGLSMLAASQSGQKVWGTPFYIAPERALGKDSDHRADIYSLGCVLFHLMAGRPPFAGASAKEVVKARFTPEPPQLASVQPDVSVAVSQVIAQMMAIKPSHRYQTYDDLLAAMRSSIGIETAETYDVAEPVAVADEAGFVGGVEDLTVAALASALGAEPASSVPVAAAVGTSRASRTAASAATTYDPTHRRPVRRKTNRGLLAVMITVIIGFLAALGGIIYVLTSGLAEEHMRASEQLKGKTPGGGAATTTIDHRAAPAPAPSPAPAPAPSPSNADMTDESKDAPADAPAPPSPPDQPQPQPNDKGEPPSLIPLPKD